MEVVPLSALPAQTVSATLGGQSVTITLRQLATGLFMDLQADGAEIVGLVVCQNLNKIVRSLYLGFLGDFMFYDNTGQGSDPSYAGLGTTYSLIYLAAADLLQGTG